MNCPVCNSDNTEKVYENKSLFFANQETPLDLVVALCADCNFFFQSSAYSEKYDRMISEVYTNFYKSENFNFPNRTENNLKALDIIISNLPSDDEINILEIGSNRGDLLYMIKKEEPHVNILGIEPTKFYDLKVPTVNSFFRKELFSSKFDVIILQHVLEHIKNPKEIIRDIKALLNNNGVLYIEVPYLIKILGHCIEDFSLEHVSYFTLSSLNNVLEGFGLVKYDLDFSLRSVWKKDLKEARFFIEEDGNLNAGIENFINKKEEITSQIVQYAHAGKKMVFYGISYYFRVLFKSLKERIDTERCFYYDDNYLEDFDNTFNLPRLKSFDDCCVVIICSNNHEVQKKIQKKISKYSGLVSIKPWSEVKINI